MYTNLTDYYLHTNNLDSLTFYKAKLDSLNRSVVQLDNDFSNSFSITGVLLNIIEDQENKAKVPMVYGAYFLGVIGILGGAMYVKKRMRSVSKSKESSYGITDFSEPESVEPITATDASLVSGDLEQDKLEKEPEKKEVKISKSTIERLELLFQEFEQSKQFLDSNVNVGSLANQFNTNNKYIAYTLKNLYNKDFATYINDLRVNYVIDLLENEPKYREYKISYLADLAGFSSHSKFATNFKKIKGLSPSEFIDSIER